MKQEQIVGPFSPLPKVSGNPITSEYEQMQKDSKTHNQKRVALKRARLQSKFEDVMAGTGTTLATDFGDDDDAAVLPVRA